MAPNGEAIPFNQRLGMAAVAGGCGGLLGTPGGIFIKGQCPEMCGPFFCLLGLGTAQTLCNKTLLSFLSFEGPNLNFSFIFHVGPVVGSEGRIVTVRY